MGNFWKGISDEQLQESEKKILAYSGISIEEFNLKRVEIDEKGNYVRTIEVGDVRYSNKIFSLQNKS